MVSSSDWADVTGGPPTEAQSGRTLPSQRRATVIPERVGRYEILGTLGEGGMGVVLRARDPSLDREVAVKLLHARLHKVGTQRMQREAQALARLSHPHVIDVYDVGIEDGHVFIAMEYVRGEPLHRWLRERPPLPQIVDAFVQAGRGLAAAHDAGLVHRDFKPANVLRGNDGRVQVVDFGLAAPSRGEDVTMESGEGHVLDVRMTATGLAVGTPSYMSPESHMGGQIDARSDQWSFCVSLYEAVYGERPFPAMSLSDLVDQVLDEPTRLPSEVVVPAAVRRVILRGLAKEPERRFPTMEALLEQLAPRRRRWWLAAAVAGTGLVTAGAVAVALVPTERSGCDQVVAAVTETWSDDVQSEIHEAFTASKLSFAEQTWLRVAPTLDERFTELAQARRQACEAGSVESAAPESIDRRVACLGRQLSDLRAVVDVFRQADTTTVRNAVQVVGELRGVESCEGDALAGGIPPPPAELADQVARVEADMARIRALTKAGSYDQARPEIERVLQDATQLGYAPLLAEVAMLRARTLISTGEYEAAASGLLDAHEQGQTAGHDELVAEASTALIFVMGNHLRRTDEARRWVRHAQSAIERLPAPGLMEPELEAHLGALERASGDYATALDHFERALVEFESQLGLRHPRTLRARADVAVSHHLVGNNERARALMEAVLAERVEVYGDAHPQVSSGYSNLAIIEQTLGKLEASAEHSQRSLDIIEAAFGVEHPDYPRVLTNLANTMFFLGRKEESARMHQRSQELIERSLGPRDYLVGRSLVNLGAVYYSMEDFERSRQAYVRAKDILEEHLDPEHPDLANLAGNLAHVDRETGRLSEALAGFDRAIERLETLHGPDHLELSGPLAGRGEVHLDSDRPKPAAADFRRAVALMETTERNPKELAVTRYHLAVSLGQSGELADARAAMEQAHTEAKALGEGGGALVEKIERWKAEHGGE